MERHAEPERVLVGEHAAAPVRQDPALGGAGREGRHDLLGVEAGLDGQHETLGHAEVGPGEDHLVDGLGGLAGAHRAEVGDGPADRREDRAGPLDVGRLAAAPGSPAWRCAPPRCRRSRAHRRSRPPARRGGPRSRGWPPGRSWSSRSRASRPRRRRQPRRRRRARPRHRACRRRRPRRRRRRRPAPPGSPRSPRPARPAPVFARRPVPGAQRKAGPREIDGHRAAHGPQPGDPDPLHGRSPPQRPPHRRRARGAALDDSRAAFYRDAFASVAHGGRR